MGCDIHLYAEHKKNERWRPLRQPTESRYAEGRKEYPSEFDDRNYDVFAILANVRNGRGFAGAQTGTGFNPISDPRGLPEDLSAEFAAAHESLDDGPSLWFGDHSHSYLTLAELLDFDYTQTTNCCGVLSWTQYVGWRFGNWSGATRNNEPRAYCGGVSGHGIVVHPDESVFAERYDELTDERRREIARDDVEHVPFQKEYACCWWEVDYAYTMQRFASKVILPLAGEASKRGLGLDCVRVVFGFDS